MKPTKQEQILSEALSKQNIDHKVQYWDGHKHYDVFVPQLNLSIEVDGDYHIGDGDQFENDLWRDYYSFLNGVFTKRISNKMVEKYSDQIAAAIKKMEIEHGYNRR